MELPDIIDYNKDKEQTAYKFGYISGSMLLTILLVFIGKNAADVLADKQLMGNLMGNAKLQFRGILLKAGKILAADYPAGKIGADTAEKICEKAEDGETDAEEIAEDVSEETEKWSRENLDVEKMFTEKSIEHLEEIDGFDRRHNGIKGAHTLESFNRFSEEFRPVKVLSKEKISDGIYETQYKAAKIEGGKLVIKPDGTYEFLSNTYKKTVIDTSEISIDQITSMAKEAFTSRGAYVTEKNQIYINGITKNGVKFDGWINSETKQLESFYPVKDWRYDY